MISMGWMGGRGDRLEALLPRGRWPDAIKPTGAEE
jgi:hypothetical protein